MSLKIIFLNRSFYPDISATSQLLTELCEDLVQDYACHVTVISGMPLYPKDSYTNDSSKKGIIARDNFNGIEILRVKNTAFSPKSFLGRISNYLTYFFLSFIASFKLKKPDLVVTLTDPPIICLIGFFIAIRFNIPLIISVRDIFPEAAMGLEDFQNHTLNLILDKINRFCFKRASRIICLGRLMQEKITEEKGISPKKTSIITDWVDCNKIYPIAKRNVFSLEHNLSDFFVVMYSGNIGALSGLEILIDSAELLRDRKDILFVLIGEGIKKDNLIERAKNNKLENIRFFPYQSQGMLFNSFSSADIFVIPLKKGMAGYSLPSKIYAVMASGRPYVACVEEESEVAQITAEFNCGILARPQDPKDLAEKILRLYEDKELRIKLGDSARNAAIFFDRAKGAKAYYELFCESTKDKKNL